MKRFFDWVAKLGNKWADDQRHNHYWPFQNRTQAILVAIIVLVWVAAYFYMVLTK